METQNKLKLAEAKQNVLQKAASEARDLRQKDQETLDAFLRSLADLINQGIPIRGSEHIDELCSVTEQFGQQISDTVRGISDLIQRIPNLDELNIPESIRLNNITDDRLLAVLEKIGDNGELLQKFNSLDASLVLLSEAIQKDALPRQTEEEYLPVRIVLGRTGALRFLESWPMPTFGGTSGTDITPIKGFALGQYDAIYPSYPSATEEIYVYKLAGVTVATLTVDYVSSAKDQIVSVIKT